MTFHSNLRDADNLSTADKLPAPSASVIQRFYCIADCGYAYLHIQHTLLRSLLQQPVSVARRLSASWVSVIRRFTICTVFIQIVAAVTINFAPSSVRLLIEGGSYSRAATIYFACTQWLTRQHACVTCTHTPTRWIYRAHGYFSRAALSFLCKRYVRLLFDVRLLYRYGISARSWLSPTLCSLKLAKLVCD